MKHFVGKKIKILRSLFFYARISGFSETRKTINRFTGTTRWARVPVPLSTPWELKKEKPVLNVVTARNVQSPKPLSVNILLRTTRREERLRERNGGGNSAYGDGNRATLSLGFLICWDLRIICVVCRERELHMVRQASSRIFHLRKRQLKRQRNEIFW